MTVGKEGRGADNQPPPTSRNESIPSAAGDETRLPAWMSRIPTGRASLLAVLVGVVVIHALLPDVLPILILRDRPGSSGEGGQGAI
ncbi:hypothetical protein [Streptomyces sp. WAC01526]|uniref:hypothetical protein n=1 Tax=Streptomyces sp. WAC01526 TaxID=2588709 RepID=UPI0011E05721|nr:hypothetical protein [Streptomyces sp. WAC01526]